MQLTTRLVSEIEANEILSEPFLNERFIVAIDAFPIHYCGGLVGLVTAPFLINEGIFFKQDRASAMVRSLLFKWIIDHVTQTVYLDERSWA